MRARSAAVASGPFDCFFTPEDPLVFLNYAIPREPVGAAHAAGALPGLEALFVTHDRVPRFEFVATFAPELADTLVRHAYTAEPGSFAMTASPAELTEPRLASDCEFARHGSDAPEEQIRQALSVRHTSFGMPNYAPDAAAIAAYRRAAARSPHGVIMRGGEVVALGTQSAAWDGVAEIAGIAVREDMRGQGIGGALTALLARHAFEAGVQSVHLTAADARAASVYARVGFAAAAHTVLAYIRNQP